MGNQSADSGGDDSSKENKENTANGDESNNAVKSKKGQLNNISLSSRK